MDNLPARIDQNTPLFPISTAASSAGMHPQTLRTYDRLGLVVPTRARGRGRRYSVRDIARLKMIQDLSQDEGINLNGVRRILELESELDAYREQVRELTEELRRARTATLSARVFAVGHDGIRRV